MTNMTNDKNSTASVISRLEAEGFRAALIPFSCIEQIKNIYRSYEESENAPFSAKSWFFCEQPPDITFKALSILIVAFQSQAGELILKHRGNEISLPIPPTYLDDFTVKRLVEVLGNVTDGYMLKEVKSISLKLLAVLGGLGKYGRNALCYLEGFGSFCNFAAYYTDIPCENNTCEPTFMDQCEACSLCADICPNNALGGRMAIDTSRCLTMWNEHNGPLPGWIMPDVHHAAVGCIRCQEVCPVNKAVQIQKKEALELSEEETEILLQSQSTGLPQELSKRLTDYGLWNMFISLAGRNAKLVIEAAEM